MRRLAILAGLMLMAVAIYAFLPRSQPPAPPPSEPAVASAQSAPEPRPPRLVPVRAGPDANGDTRRAVANEATLMQQLRLSVKSDPPLAESLAREGRQRFADSADSDERDALLVDALINQQRIGAARSETYYYLDHHPGGRFAEHLFVMTGVHPSPKPGPP
jgi:hypothetical protein